MASIKIEKVDNRIFLQIGEEVIEVSDYNIKNSADGTTELSVTIKGNTNEVEWSANLELQKQ